MTINIPIETYKRHLEAKRILERIINYAPVNTTATPGILASDLDAAKKIVQELSD